MRMKKIWHFFLVGVIGVIFTVSVAKGDIHPRKWLEIPYPRPLPDDVFFIVIPPNGNGDAYNCRNNDYENLFMRRQEYRDDFNFNKVRFHRFPFKQ
jgi:hypothetical protein